MPGIVAGAPAPQCRPAVASGRRASPRGPVGRRRPSRRAAPSPPRRPRGPPASRARRSPPSPTSRRPPPWSHRPGPPGAPGPYGRHDDRATATDPRRRPGRRAGEARDRRRLDDARPPSARPPHPEPLDRFVPQRRGLSALHLDQPHPRQAAEGTGDQTEHRDRLGDRVAGLQSIELGLHRQLAAALLAEAHAAAAHGAIPRAMVRIPGADGEREVRLGARPGWAPQGAHQCTMPSRHFKPDWWKAGARSARCASPVTRPQVQGRATERRKARASEWAFDRRERWSGRRDGVK